MSRAVARIAWRCDRDFTTGRYSRRHAWAFDGGAAVHASSSPAIVPVPFSDPAGVDPEEALVAATASCHMLWFLDLARQQGLDIEGYEDEAEGELGRSDTGALAMVRITLRPRIRFAGVSPDAAVIDRLHEQAHARCFIANSLKAEILVESRG